VKERRRRAAGTGARWRTVEGWMKEEERWVVEGVWDFRNRELDEGEGEG